MPDPSALHQLGSFIFRFQALEAAVLEMLELIADSDCELVRIVADGLEYSKKPKALDVGYSRRSQIVGAADDAHRRAFHALIVELGNLGERRNKLVHSFYVQWANKHGHVGLIRRHSQLSGSRGTREESEELLQPDTFNADLAQLEAASAKLEQFRLQFIAWQYPD